MHKDLDAAEAPAMEAFARSGLPKRLRVELVCVSRSFA